MITIDELRELAEQNNTEPAWNGLGVVKLRFAPKDSPSGDKSLAYHFYSDRTEANYHPIHDHVFSFSSTVLKGTLESTFYDFVVTDQEMLTPGKETARPFSPAAAPYIGS